MRDKHDTKGKKLVLKIMEIATEKVKNENNTNIKHQTLKLLKQFGRRCDNDDSTEPARQRHHLTAAVAAVECCRFEDRG